MTAVKAKRKRRRIAAPPPVPERAMVLVERAGEHRADQAARHGDEHRVIARAHPVVTARRGIEVTTTITAPVVDHPVIMRLALVAALAAAPVAELRTAGHGAVDDHGAARLVAHDGRAPLVVTILRGGGRRGGHAGP